MKTRIGVSLGILALAGMFGSGCSESPQAKEARYLRSGKEFLKNKDHRRAIIELSNAVQAMPTDGEAYYQLGLAYLAAGDPAPAVTSLHKATTLNPKHSGAQIALSQLLASSGERALLQDAESRLRTLLADAPANPDTLNTLAFTEIKLGKPEEAMNLLSEALKQSPQPIASAVLMAKARLIQKDLPGAEDVLRRACQDHPKSANCRVVLGGFFNRVNKPLDAIEEFQKALQIESNNAPALLYLAITEHALGRKAEAEQDFRRLSASPLKTYRLLYGVFLFQEGRRDEAVREFENVSRQSPSDRLARTQLVAVYRAVGRIADAERILTDALRKNPKDVDALLQRSALAIEAGRTTAAQTDVNQVLGLRPYSAEAHYILSRIHQSQGAVLSRRQELFESIRLNPYLLPVRLELAGLLVGSNAATTAMQVLDAAPEPQKNEPGVRMQRNWVLIALKDKSPELRSAVETGLRTQRSAELLLQSSVLRLRDGDPAGARSAVEEALAGRPDDIRALEVLVQIFRAQKQSPAAIERVKRYVAQRPGSAAAQGLLGNLLLEAGDRVQARAAFAAAKAASPGALDADLAIARIDIADGEIDSARNILTGVASSRTATATTAHLWLGNLEEMGGNHGAAAEHFRQVLQVDGNNTQALNNLAYYLAEYANQPDEALKYAEKARELAPDSAAGANTLGWVLYRKGLYSLAVQHLATAVDKGDTPRRRCHLAMAYAKLGQKQRARELFAALRPADRNLPEAVMAHKVISEMP